MGASTAIERKLAQQRHVLDALNRDVDALIYAVLHDFAAPMRHINGFMTMFRKRVDAQIDEESRRYLDKISMASDNMAHMMHELLAFSRDTGGELNPMTVSLRGLIQSAIGDLAPVIADRHIDWRIGELPAVWADRRLLRQAIDQLLGNAIKFTRRCPLPRIDITAKEDDDGVVLRIQDNGDGFNMKYADRLFRLFHRLHTEAEFEGSGRGLVTVARIVGRHGGRVWADAIKGEGASFFVLLPCQT